MTDNAKGSAESRSAALSLFSHSLDDYIDKVLASNQSTNDPNVPKQVKDSIDNSIQASIDYHDFMCDAHLENDDSGYVAYHKVKADTYRALKTN